MKTKHKVGFYERLTLLPCEICGWKLCVERHRIVPGREGGSYTKDNTIVLCPNHHALADRGKLKRRSLKKIIEGRSTTTKLLLKI